MPRTRRHCGTFAMGRRQKLDHRTLPALSLSLGEIPFLERGRPTVRRQLAAGLRVHRACGRLWSQTPRYGQYPRHRCRRDPVSEGASLPDPGLSDRLGMQEASVYRTTANSQDTSEIFQTAGQGALRDDSGGLQ